MLNRRGFTLIELLVVIAIIGILSVIGLVAYSNFLKSARDSKRQSDLKIIQSALEDFRADQLSYPAQSDPPTSLPSPLINGTKVYLNTTPQDPKPDQSYIYTSSANSYCLYAKMEKQTGNSFETGCNTPPQADYNYSVTRP